MTLKEFKDAIESLSLPDNIPIMVTTVFTNNGIPKHVDIKEIEASMISVNNHFSSKNPANISITSVIDLNDMPISS